MWNLVGPNPFLKQMISTKQKEYFQIWGRKNSQGDKIMCCIEQKKKKHCCIHNVIYYWHWWVRRGGNIEEIIRKRSLDVKSFHNMTCVNFILTRHSTFVVLILRCPPIFLRKPTHLPNKCRHQRILNLFRTWSNYTNCLDHVDRSFRDTINKVNNRESQKVVLLLGL